MKFSSYLTKSFFLLALLTIGISCEKETQEDPDTTINVPVKLVTTDSQNTIGSLLLDYRVNGYQTAYNDIRLNEVIEIEIEYSSEMYNFTSDDPIDGQINMWIDDDELKSYTKENPLILKYGHYKENVVAEYTVEVTTETTADVTVEIEYNGLYHIDWGDGEENVLKGERTSRDKNYIEHYYQTEGAYNITITTTNLEDVSTLELQTRNYQRRGIITALSIGDLPNLNLLDIGDNTLSEAVNIAKPFPKLKYLFLGPGQMKTINLENNKDLENLMLRGEPYEVVEGLSGLTKLKSLSLKTSMESLDASPYPELENLNVFSNTITSLNLTANTKLTSIWLIDTQLSELDLSANTAITSIIIDNASLPVYNFSNQNQLEYLAIRALARGEIIYPTNMNNIMTVDYSGFSQIADVIEFTNLLLESQKENPRNKVNIKYPRNRYPSLTQQDELAALANEWGWIIEYRNN